MVVRLSNSQEMAEDFYLKVAQGEVGGHTFINKFGANFDVDTGTDPETIWSQGGLYPWASLATASTLTMVSTEDADTSNVEIQGLDANYNLLTETLTLTGTTPVVTVNAFLRVFRIIYNHTGVNAGDITASVGGVVVAKVDAGLGQTLMCVYTIPANYTGYLVQLSATAQKNKDAQIRLLQRPVNTSFKIVHMAEVFEDSYKYDPKIPIVLAEKTDIDFVATEAEANNTRITGTFEILLVSN
jgi:hypothetical protein